MDPTGRRLQPATSKESLGDRGDGKQKNHTKNDNKPKKPAAYTGKANSKLNAGRSAMTDAKFWVQKIQEDQALPEVTSRKMTLGLVIIRQVNICY